MFNRKFKTAVDFPACINEPGCCEQPWEVTRLSNSPIHHSLVDEYLDFYVKALNNSRQEAQKKETIPSPDYTPTPVKTTPKVVTIGGLVYKDISSEEWREYIFDEGEVLRINFPIGLHVSENGHRVFDEAGLSYYIPHYFNAIRFKSKAGLPPFAF